MDKINIFISPFTHFNIKTEIEVNKLKDIINIKDNNYFNYTNKLNADIILIHIFEIDDCYFDYNKYIVLYLHFKPNIDEIDKINSIIQYKSVILILSHFNIENWNIHKQILWPIKNDVSSYIEKKKCDEIWDDIFNFDIIYYMNIGKYPIINNIPSIYKNVLETGIKPKSLSYLYYLEFMYNFITKSISLLKENFTFLPLLNISGEKDMIVSNHKLCQQICLSKTDDLCYCSHFNIKTFIPWGLFIAFNDLSQGLYVKNKSLQSKHFLINPNEYCLFYLEIPNNFKHIDNWESYIKDNNGVCYTGLPLLNKLILSENTIYIKKPYHKINKFGIITYIDNLDNINHFIKIIEKLNNNYFIEIYYDIDIVETINIKETDKVKMHKINTNSFKNSKNIQLDIILYILLNTTLQKCLFFEIDYLIWGDLNHLLESKYNKYDAIFIQNYKDNNVLELNNSIFFINTDICWIAILITLGLIKTNTKEYINDKGIELLYIALKNQNHNSLIYKEDLLVKCHGYIENNIFIGYPIYNIDTFFFTFIPIWFNISKSNFITDFLYKIDWIYSDIFEAIIVNKEECIQNNFYTNQFIKTIIT